MLKKVLFIITAIMCMSLCSCGEHTKKSSYKLDSESVAYSEKDSKTDIVATLKYDNDETHKLIIGDETHEICGFTDDLDTINKILSEYFPGIQSHNERYLESDTCDCSLVLQECSVGQRVNEESGEEPVYDFSLGKCYMLVFGVDHSTGYFSIPLCLFTLDGLDWKDVEWFDLTSVQGCCCGYPIYNGGLLCHEVCFPGNNIILTNEEDFILMGFKERERHIQVD